MNSKWKTFADQAFSCECLVRLPSILSLFFCALTAQAQWQDVEYGLPAGWSAIYLHGDASYDAIENLLPDAVEEVWRWQPDSSAAQFILTPLVPSSGVSDWDQWTRSAGAGMTLLGQSAYLVKCSTATSFTLRQMPQPPAVQWAQSGANLLGFPTSASGGYPTFANYFATFPAATQANSTIYKYIGGDFSPSNPLQIPSPTLDTVDRDQAYWFSAEVAGDFYAPIEIELSNNAGLLFGRTGSVNTLWLRNRSANSVTVSLALEASAPAPGTSTAIPAVPLTRLTYNPSTLLYEPEALPAANDTVQIDPNSSVEVKFGINRADASMSSAAENTLFASILRLTDAGNLIDVSLPVSAQKGSLAGLWVGDIELTSVGSKVSNVAQAQATVAGGTISALQVSGTGGYGYSDQSLPTVTIAPPAAGGVQATATAQVTDGRVSGFTLTNAGSGYEIDSPLVSVAAPPPLAGTSTPRSFPLRTLLHIADDAQQTTSLLSQIFIGPLAATPNTIGLTTRESLLQSDAKATAQRLVAAHMPLDQAISSGSGAVSVPGSLIRTITVPFDAPSNPFVHQYHPDHDNTDARAAALAAGVESYDISRTCTFTFTASPPAGSNAAPSSWGITILGGTYTESITGIHKDPIEMGGRFELRRASELGTLVTD